MEKLSIYKFSEELEKKSAASKTPFSASLEITYGCNLRCIHCYNPTHKALPTEKKYSELTKVLDQIAELGCFSILFTGGEPLVRQDAFKLMHYATKLGMQVILYTNATLIDEEKMAQIKELAPSQASVSVYGHSRETYEAVTRIPGSFQRFIRGRDLLIASGIPLHFKMPVLKINVHEFDKIQTWYRERSLPFTFTVDISPGVDGDLSPLEHRLSAEQAAQFRLSHDNLEPDSEPRSCRRSNSGKLFDCNCGKTSFAVNPYGEMNLCTSLAYPKFSLQTGSVKEGWNLMVNSVQNAEVTDAFECPSCPVAHFCTQGAMDAWLEKKDFNPCLPYYKDVASLVKKAFDARSETKYPSR